MANSKNNSSRRSTSNGAFRGQPVPQPAQRIVKPGSMPPAKNGVGTTSISTPPVPQPSGPIPGSVGGNDIATPPAPKPAPELGTKGLGANQIAVPPQIQSRPKEDSSS